MSQQLTWQEIEQRFDHEWVELVDYVWPEGEPFPISGIVRTHASKRKEFYDLANQEPVPRDSAILFVGRPKRSPGQMLCSSVMRIERADPQS